jgi:serine/threonine protein kinase
MELQASYYCGEESISAINQRIAFRSRIPDSCVRLTEFLKRKAHQLSVLINREDLKSVLALQETETPLDAGYRIGDTIHTLLGGCVPARYQIYGVNSGGYGIIYTVLDQETLTPYCLKTARRRSLDDFSRAERLKQEARTWLRLDRHPNIVFAHSLLEINGHKSILLEYVSGGDLASRIRKDSLPLDEALNYGIQFCRGMRHAQTLIPAFIHGDVKPSNCLITEAGTLKITDFGHVGVSKVVTRHARRRALAPDEERFKTSEFFAGGGTPPYMAPELFDVSSRPDSRIDVYAFGILLYEMLVGRRPFPGKTYEDYEEQHRLTASQTVVPDVPDIPRRLAALITSCLARSPEHRPPNFGVIEEVLNAVRLDLGEDEIPHEPSESLSANELINRGSSLMVLGLYDEALDCFNSLTQSKTQAAVALNHKAQILLKCDHELDAVKCLNHALDLNPRLALTWNHKGQVLSQMGNYQEALACFERSLALDPQLSFAWSNRGRMLAEEGRFQAANKSLSRALAIDPYQATAHNNQGIVHFKQGLDGIARESFKKAISLNPLLADAYSNLGDTSRRLGLTQDAIDAYRSALKLKPELAIVKERLGLAYGEVYCASPKYRGEQYTTLLIAFLLDHQTDSQLVLNSGLNLLRVSGFDPIVLYLCGEKIYHSLAAIKKDQREALTDSLSQVRRNLFAGALNQQSSYWLGKIFYGLDLFDECASVFQHFNLRHGPDDRSLYYLAACDEVRGRYAEALINYRQALTLDPDCFLTRAAIERVESKLSASMVEKAAHS